MILEHYSRELIKKEDLVLREQRSPLFKPTGLWVSVKGPNDWPTWCKYEEFWSSGTFMHVYKVVLSPSANILYLRTEEEVLAFSQRFRHSEFDYMRSFVSWSEVIELYDGIIIPYYHQNLRFHPDLIWYYAWDCTSGCIWNVQEAISEFTKIKSLVIK